MYTVVPTIIRAKLFQKVFSSKKNSTSLQTSTLTSYTPTTIPIFPVLLHIPCHHCYPLGLTGLHISETKQIIFPTCIYSAGTLNRSKNERIPGAGKNQFPIWLKTMYDCNFTPVLVLALAVSKSSQKAITGREQKKNPNYSLFHQIHNILSQ